MGRTQGRGYIITLVELRPPSNEQTLKKITVSIDQMDGRMDECRNERGEKELIENNDNNDSNDQQPSNAKPLLVRPSLLVSFE